ncbi:hypothetical protein PFUM301597_06690 [Pseudomonas fluorescens]|jgi:hypothetical protein
MNLQGQEAGSGGNATVGSPSDLKVSLGLIILMSIQEGTPMQTTPPEGLPVYRLLTGKDDASFCHRVSEALALGYQLYGSPAATFNGEHVVVAQAIVWNPVK